MAGYTRSELLNEVSKVFRAGLDPGRDGGTLNTATEYQQLLEMVSISLLLNPDSVFYVARLAANQLNYTISQEVAVLEDILVSLDDLSQIGAPVRDTASLSNARTAVLALDAAESVSNRPETQRFMRQMDAFATQLRKNLVSVPRSGLFVRPREEARNLIQTNLTSLDELHNSLLARVVSLRDMLKDFLAQDLPSRVSSSVLSSVNSRLQSSIEEVSTESNTDNLAANRRLFLETLANKVSVQVLATFVDPTDLKYRSPLKPIPSTLKHTGQVTGQGTAASVLTNAGPWELPISAPLVLSASGGSPVSIDLDIIRGAVLTARNSEPYEITSANRYLHAIVDPEIREGTAIYSGTGWVATNQYMRLGFKHLGALVSLPDSDTGIDPNDIHTRFITDLMGLQSAAAPNISCSGSILTVTAFIADNEGAIGFQPGHVGAYVKDTFVGSRFEIVKVISPNQCVLDVRGWTPAFSSGLQLLGSFSSGVGTNAFGFQPPVTTAPAPGDRVIVGPSVKTATFTVGSRTAASLLSDFYLVAGLNDPADEGARMYWHVSPELASGDPSRLSLRIRSKLNPFIQITGRFLRPRDPVGLIQLDGNSAHPVLGFFEGESDTTNLLTPAELVELIRAQPGFAAEVVTTELASGTLETVASLARVTDQAGANFTALGVSANDQIEISDGTIAGTYRVTAVVPTSSLTLDRTAFIAKEGGLSYRVFREQVKISISDAGPNTYLDVTSAPAELGLSATTVYSSIPYFEAVDKLGNKLSFDNALPGDLLKIAGQSEVEILEVSGTTLTLVTGLPSTTAKLGFEIRSAGARAFTQLNAALSTYVASSNLLGKNHYDESVDAITNACTQAILPGQNFVASRNQARKMVVDLLAILTADLTRQDEYTVKITPNPNNLAGILADYSAASVPEVDDLVSMLADRKYDRAAALLSSGKFTDFFATNSETGSYGGAVMSASRNVVKDLPETSRTREDFLNQRDLAKATQSYTDAETDYSDTENEPEDLDL